MRTVVTVFFLAHLIFIISGVRWIFDLPWWKKKYGLLFQIRPIKIGQNEIYNGIMPEALGWKHDDKWHNKRSSLQYFYTKNHRTDFSIATLAVRGRRSFFFSLDGKETKDQAENIFIPKIIERIFSIPPPAASLGGHSLRPTLKSLPWF